MDGIVATLDNALARTGLSMKKVDRWKLEMPTEQEMLPKDKYTVFDRKVKRYRKGIHSESHFYSINATMAIGDRGRDKEHQLV